MASADDVMVAIFSLQQQLNELKSHLVIDGSQVIVKEGLSDIDESLGTIVAGEFRAGSGSPGKGFSGTRMVYPTVEYDGQRWNLVGVDNDVIQWGARSSDGKIMAGAGAVTLDAKGIRIKTQGVQNYHRRPISIWHPDDPLELALRVRDPDLNDCDAPALPRRQGNLTYRAPGTTSTYPFWTVDFQTFNNDTVTGTDALTWYCGMAVQPTDSGPAYMRILHYTDQSAASDNRTEFRLRGPGTDNPAHLYMLTAQQDFEIIDADTAGASAEGWIEVEIGNVVSYIRTYATK